MEGSFEILGLTGYSLGLWVAGGMLALFAAMLFLGRKSGLKPQSICWLTILSVVLGIAGARLLYCLVNVSAYVEAYENLWLMFRFFDGGLSLYGMVLGLLVAVVITAALCKEDRGAVMDVLCVPLGIFLCAVFLGQQNTGLGIGRIVEEGAATQALPWLFLSERMGKNIEYRMLVYLYQAIVSLVIAITMIGVYLRSIQKPGFRTGETAWLSLALYSAAMVVLESLRNDGHMLIIFLRIGQVVAALLVIVAVIFFSNRYMKLVGKMNMRSLLGWLSVVLLIIGVVLLEFALDGRLPTGNLTTGHLYLLMTLLVVLVSVAACLLYAGNQKQRAAMSEHQAQ